MIKHGDSASATDENYCMALLSIDGEQDLLNPANWRKKEDVLVYHARNYTEIEGDPLWDPNRHTRLKNFIGCDNGTSDFGVLPAAYTSVL